MYDEYIELYNTYTKKYGKNTAVFLMVGSFYELYDIINTETGETKCNVREITDILGIQLSSKKKDFGKNHDGLFAGFPDYVMHKWAGRLTSIGWTVIVVDQVKDSKGKVKERKVSRILSPSTHIENIQNNETPYIMTFYFQGVVNQVPHFGAAILDLSTGTTHTYLGKASGRPDIWTADDLVQMISVFQPKEVLVYWKADISIEESYFKRIFGLQNIPIHIRNLDKNHIDNFSIDLVRSEYLRKIYSIKSLLPEKVFLGLRSDYEELALLYLLQFIEEHYPSILKSFHRNEPWIPDARLICGNHALTQLQMTANNQNECVIGLFNAAITPMGKRAIKLRLLSPYSQANEIRARLNEVKELMEWPENTQKKLDRQLRFMYDLPRLHRKLLCGLITRQEIAGLFQTYNSIENIILHITPDTILKQPFTFEQWTTYITSFKENFSEEKALQDSNDITAFNTEKYTEIGAVENKIQTVLNNFQLLIKEVAENAEVNEDALRLESREKEPFGIKCSSSTLQKLKKNSKKLPDGAKVTELKSGGWFDCKLLQNLNQQLVKLRDDLKSLIHKYLIEACHNISEAGEKIWVLMEEWVQHIDCTQCIVRVSNKLGFSCPNIEDVTEESGSGFTIQNIRHPLVEATASRVSYVTHDVSLGMNGVKGWLVYGMNASGKSTLMKATGIAILLAQAGCFVPATEMILRPFKSIYTRILNQDNLFSGLSSFAVEMSELRDILINANQNTLVLGDELCSGTESTSAQALVSAGIQYLSEKNAKFIFATHLHDIPNVIDVKSLCVDVWHLHVDYDPISKVLKYDRSLRKGSGSSLYGIEVAKAFDLPFAFIEQALKNRHVIDGSTDVTNAKKSFWNSSIIRKECENCGLQLSKELEVHHIKERNSAINGILENGTHMNNMRNLIVVCQKCHDSIHNNSIEIGSVIQTSEGSVRSNDDSVSEISSRSSDSKRNKKAKWSDEDLQIINSVIEKFKSSSLKAIRAYLESKHQITVSEGVLSKMRRGDY